MPVLALCVGALCGHLLGSLAGVPWAQGPWAGSDLWSVTGGLMALGGVCWRDHHASAGAHRDGRDGSLPE